jgi:3-deoxy-D-manno-octulosonate 8-phosphate phosphatase (KDO 8-P phosphatase)
MDRVLYIGNDLNDYDVMMRCGVSVCPADSHPIIKEMANFVLETRGGDGVARELLENLLNVDFLKILCGK